MVIAAKKPLLVVLALVLMPCARARAQDDTEGRRPLTIAERRANAEAAWESRDFDYTIALLVGFASGWLHVDGQEADTPSPFFLAGLEQALSYRVTKTRAGVAITLVNRLTGISYEYRSLTHIDLALGPELRLLQRVFRPTVSWRFRVTGGYSLGFVNDRAGRAVYETYSTGSGPNIGTAVVAALAGPRMGGFIQFGTFHRLLNVDATAELNSDPSVRASTLHEYTQHEILFGGGMLVRF
jgi:hypothetical protein